MERHEYVHVNEYVHAATNAQCACKNKKQHTRTRTHTHTHTHTHTPIKQRRKKNKKNENIVSVQFEQIYSFFLCFLFLFVSFFFFFYLKASLELHSLGGLLSLPWSSADVAEVHTCVANRTKALRSAPADSTPQVEVKDTFCSFLRPPPYALVRHRLCAVYRAG